MNIDFAALNAGVLWPEYAVTITLVVLLLVDLTAGRKVARALPYITLLGLGIATALLLPQWIIANPDSFLGSFTADPLSVAFRAFVLLSAALTVLMSIRYIDRTSLTTAEFYELLLGAVLGAMLLSGASEMVMIFVALELLSITSYLLAGYTKLDKRSNEASLKYLLIGSASSGIFLYGLSLLYGFSGGQTRLLEIAPRIVDLGFPALLSLVLVVAGICFKIAAVPFHQWTPDVYEGSPTPVVAFLSVGSKAAGFALAIRFLTSAYPAFTGQWQTLFVLLAILSMVLGNVVAIAQTSMKRMLAYSSIAQAGYVMIGLAIGTPQGYSSMIIYIGTYLFMNLGAFMAVVLFSLRTGTDEITAYSGLYQKDPFLTLVLSLCLLSLAGIPPLAGFFGKLYLFWAAVQSQAYTLVFFGLVTSVASIYYYVRVVKLMLVKEPSPQVLAYGAGDGGDSEGIQPLKAGMLITTIATVVLGIFFPTLISLTDTSLRATPSLTPANRAASVSQLPVHAAPAAYRR
ncbi:NAD(P)H-quinone oxidoreductase subunit N [Gloeobacter kilaueensis]|uniref:NAD(P)H-quinone oxidoreductase subunit 2 n=1 Tax=Gloeobacter kilaueensis (strain ATCC BAA-2537 / CCAP 1431/1 / ULC 316 / JS1) TaxID=1183438 RepID=U5QP60_GLOK1|nr:NAD(P)H-quinone oxidoreductase subunit N [Gloeobacter kilaueensis]AGY60683.1 NAD(P)H-quinone oxidoreductase subunit 2 [Gloeobacter kilaueensis JS1]